MFFAPTQRQLVSDDILDSESAIATILETLVRTIILCLFLLTGAAAWANDTASWRPSSEEEQRLDTVAFEGLDKDISGNFGDVQSVMVIHQGRKVYEFYRDGQPDALRAVHSVVKSALALLVGTALQRGQISSLDHPVLELMPEWKMLNADPRAASITLQHLLSMTPGFDINDPTGTAPALVPAAAWSRSLGAEPGQRFAYDNSVPAIISAALEKVTGRPIGDLARDQLFMPLAMREPALAHGRLSMRTEDMAKLGYLMLRGGRWADEPLMPPGFAAQVARPQNGGGVPVRQPYGLLWWVASVNTYFASGYGGQLVWVHAPLDLVVAVTSKASPRGAQRGQALRLARGQVFQAVQKRLSAVSGQ